MNGDHCIALQSLRRPLRRWRPCRDVPRDGPSARVIHPPLCGIVQLLLVAACRPRLDPLAMSADKFQELYHPRKWSVDTSQMRHAESPCDSAIRPPPPSDPLCMLHCPMLHLHMCAPARPPTASSPLRTMRPCRYAIADDSQAQQREQEQRRPRGPFWPRAASGRIRARSVAGRVHGRRGAARRISGRMRGGHCTQLPAIGSARIVGARFLFRVV